jgi:hypothetical protein
MSSQHKTVARRLKDEFQQNHRRHQEAMDSVRKSQELLREVDALFAPRLDLKFVFTLLFLVPWLGIVNAFRRISKDSVGKEDLAAICDAYGYVLEHVAKWAWFRIGMLFRWFFDEIGNGLWSAAYMMLTLLGYLLGALIVLAVIYFVLTH